MKKLRLHVISLPHTTVTKELPYLACAYTQKILNFCEMMRSLDNEVYLYSCGDYTTAKNTEFINIFTKEEQVEYFGDKENWLTDFFSIEWNTQLPYWVEFNKRCVEEINKRKQKEDIICIIGGNCQKQIADSIPELICCEIGIGYEGIFSKYKVFESYAHMHYVSGLIKQKDGNFYDCVIPNYYDPLDFKLETKKEDYFLYVGRLIKRKGIEIAYQVCKELDVPLYIAGQGVIEHRDGYIRTNDFVLEYDKLKYLGILDVETRNEVMGKSKALFVPTLYFGPFEGVSIESLFCGTPIITTNFGCFTENNEHGKTGYRCNTFEQFLWASKNIDNIDPTYCRLFAESNFSIHKVKYMYQEYFEQLLNLWKDGWYEKNNERKKLDWLNRY